MNSGSITGASRKRQEHHWCVIGASLESQGSFTKASRELHWSEFVGDRSIITDSVKEWRRESGGGQEEGQSQTKEEEHLMNKAEEVDVGRRMKDEVSVEKLLLEN